MRVLFVSLLAAVLVGFSAAGEAPDEGNLHVHSWAFGKAYDSSFTEKEFLNTPVWRSADDNPPVPPGKAIRLAAKMRETLVTDSDAYKWQLTRVQLQPMGNERWFWLIEYDPVFQNEADHESQAAHSLCLVVLMDGTVVVPRVD